MYHALKTRIERRRGSKWRLALAAVLALGLITALGAGTGTAYAQSTGVLTTQTINDEQVLTSGWQLLGPGETATYRFEYPGNNRPVQVRMNTWPVDWAEFQVFTEQTLAEADAPNLFPVGIGQPLEDNPSTLVWEGSGETALTHLVTVGSTTDQGFPYRLIVEGLGSGTADTEATTMVAGLPGTRANLRAGPSTDYAVLQTVPAGTPITVIGEDVTGDWLRIELADGTPGWIARFLTNFTGTALILEEAPLVPTPAAPEGAAAPSPQGNTAFVVTGFPGARVNVRSGPSTADSVLRTVPDGTRLTVIGQSPAGDWLQVSLPDGEIGWVARFLTDYAATAVPAATPTPTMQTTVQAETGVAPLPGEAARLIDPPVNEELLQDRWRLLEQGEEHWYSFRHPGDGTPIQIWMVVDPRFGAGFGVYSQREAEAIRSGVDPEEIAAVGRGTPNPNEPGTLFWRGTFEEAGQFFVRVRHGTSGPVRYDIFGSGVGFSSP